MKKAERFSIYRHSFVYGNNLIVTKQFIVLNHADGTRTFTDFHRYVENPNKKVKKFNEDGNNRFIFINKFLNYAFFTIGISSLSDLTIDIGRNFLNAYGMHELPDDDEYVHRGKGTVEKCIKAVLDFYINLTNDKSSGCKIKSADLYRYITVRDIKKERIAKVPDIFLSAYKDAYEIYMAYMENKPYEADYGAFSVNGQGRAITYDSYYNKFREIIKEEMIPIYLNSNDDELVLYGQTLMEHSLSPHVFRHWFTVQLVLSGINEPGILMAFRGDTSPESALTYISNKGELEKQFSKITNETFDYTLYYMSRIDFYLRF